MHEGVGDGLQALDFPAAVAVQLCQLVVHHTHERNEKQQQRTGDDHRDDHARRFARADDDVRDDIRQVLRTHTVRWMRAREHSGCAHMRACLLDQSRPNL